MIRAKNSSLVYPDGTQALKPFDLSMGRGEIAYITGPSGSGKTSLFKLMMGMVYPSTGEFEVLGQSIQPPHAAAIRKLRKQIGPVFQEFRLLEGRSVLDNVMLGMRFLDIPRQQMKASALESICKVGLEHKLHQSIDRLSWGESQRVAIARAVARNPVLIIADEPTGNLDHVNALNILRLLASFRTQETGVIIITHATHLLDMGASGVYITMDAGVIHVERQ
ncbi:MAG: ATP-binding cassette domain-containing protein [Clostridia bacterium]